MGLLSIFNRQDTAPPTGLAADASLVERARTSARRRLIGAVVLLGMGVVAFPLVFETQPRPIPVDIPIEIPRKDGQPPLMMPVPKVAPSASRAAAPASRTEAPVAAPVVRAVAPVAASPPPSAVAKQELKAAPKIEPKPEPKAEVNVEPKPAAKVEPKPAVKAEPKPDAAAPGADAGRFVVQVGAFAEAAAVRDARSRVEKLGLVTYTQVVETTNGKRTRVRVGPFSSREEADKTAARLKAAGLPVAVMTL